MNEINIIKLIQNKIVNKNFINILVFLSYIMNFPKNIFLFIFVNYILKFNYKTLIFFFIYLESLIYSIKYFFNRKRPCHIDHNLNKSKANHISKSFPSAHSFWAYLISAMLKSKYNSNIFHIFTVLVGLSRIYLGVHYPSDVISAYFMGFCFELIIHKYKIFN